jgi:hypothetical protein
MLGDPVASTEYVVTSGSECKVAEIAFSSLKSRLNNSFEASLLALSDVAEFSTNADHLRNWLTLRNGLASLRSFDGHFPL